MGKPTYRDRVIQYLRSTTEPELAVQIARGMERKGMIKDFKREKPAVDSALKRMKDDEEAIREVAGWRLADALRVAVDHNDRP